MVKLSLKNQEVVIDQGELVSYQVDGYEFIHQKGQPGWRNSDTEMFPIIGPTAEAGFRVHVPRGNAILDQHGLLRELDYELISNSETNAHYRKNYQRGEVVMNSKYPEKSTVQRLIWPFAFQFEKHFQLGPEGLKISFHVSGEHDMPFMLGYHPAFKLRLAEPKVKTDDKVISLQEIIEVGNRALEVANCDTITLSDEKDLRVETEGFGSFMLWTEVENMVCIEPITFYPYSLGQENLHEGFMHLDTDQLVFTVNLIPL